MLGIVIELLVANIVVSASASTATQAGEEALPRTAWAGVVFVECGFGRVAEFVEAGIIVVGRELVCVV